MVDVLTLYLCILQQHCLADESFKYVLICFTVTWEYGFYSIILFLLEMYTILRLLNENNWILRLLFNFNKT